MLLRLVQIPDTVFKRGKRPIVTPINKCPNISSNMELYLTAKHTQNNPVSIERSISGERRCNSDRHYRSIDSSSQSHSASRNIQSFRNWWRSNSQSSGLCNKSHQGAVYTNSAGATCVNSQSMTPEILWFLMSIRTFKGRKSSQ